jgi:hypothetical protein
MQQGERHRVQSVLAPRVGCRLGVSVAAHPSAATCSYNSLLLSLRSFNLRNVVRVSPRTKDGALVKTVKPANRKKLSSSRDLISLKRRSVPTRGSHRPPFRTSAKVRYVKSRLTGNAAAGNAYNVADTASLLQAVVPLARQTPPPPCCAVLLKCCEIEPEGVRRYGNGTIKFHWRSV